MLKFRSSSRKLLLILAGGLILNVVNYAQGQDLTNEEFRCEQPSSVRDVLIQQAESESFNIKFVEFMGNTRTRPANSQKVQLSTH